MEKANGQSGPWKYVVLVAGFVNLALCFGLLGSIGVLIVEWREYYDIGAAAASSITIGLYVLPPIISPIAGAACQRFGCRRVCVTGGILFSVTMAIVSFSPNVPFLITMICFIASGVFLVLISTYPVIGYYFRGHLGFANGVMVSGASAGILTIPPLLQFLCTTYGWRGALLVMSAVYVHSIVSGMIFRPTQEEKLNIAKTRSKRVDKGANLPESPLDKGSVNITTCLEREDTHNLSTDASVDKILCTSDMDTSVKQEAHTEGCWTSVSNLFRLVLAPFLRIIRFLNMHLLWENPRMGLFCLIAITANVGYISHLFYLISRAVYDLGISKQDASMLMVTIGLSGIIGAVAHGPIVDKGILSLSTLLTISLVISGISSIFNPLANTFSSQVILAIIFGIGSGVFKALIPLYIRQLVGQQLLAGANALRLSSQSFGAIVGSIGMGALYDETESYTVLYCVAGGVYFLSAAIMGAMAYQAARKSTQDQQTA